MSQSALVSTREKVGRLVYIAAGGKISQEDLTRTDADLRYLGLDSLGYLNLLEGLERTFGVEIHFEEEDDHTFLHTIDNIATFLVEQDSPAS